MLKYGVSAYILQNEYLQLNKEVCILQYFIVVGRNILCTKATHSKGV